MFFQLPRFFYRFFPTILWKVKDEGKKIYLTFDDGPIPEITTRVLDILDDFQWKATFFCVGDNVRKYPEIYKDIIRRGHKTGNHTYNHLKGRRYSNIDYINNVSKAENHISSDVFRPPYGSIKKSQLEQLRKKYRIVMWDVITYDYHPMQNPDGIMKILRRRLSNGSIVVFHDSLKSRNNLLETLPKALEFWQTSGYSSGLI
jgi:peptidoglycan/xylan/chitin deacetylase (PgdA/CDA1 family)